MGPKHKHNPIGNVPIRNHSMVQLGAYVYLLTKPKRARYMSLRFWLITFPFKTGPDRPGNIQPMGYDEEQLICKALDGGTKGLALHIN